MATSQKGILARAGRALAALALVSLPQAGLAEIGQTGTQSRSARARTIVPDFAFMVGSWTDDGNCANAARFDRDGRFHTADGAEGLWVVDGGKLILTGSTTLTMRVAPIDRNTVTVLNSDGSRGRSIRCASAGGGAGGGAPASVKLDQAYVVGRWTDDGNCSNATEIHADGRFMAGSGPHGTWRLDGNRMTLTGSSTLVLGVVPIDRNVMHVINEDGSLGRSTRC